MIRMYCFGSVAEESVTIFKGRLRQCAEANNVRSSPHAPGCSMWEQYDPYLPRNWFSMRAPKHAERGLRYPTTLLRSCRAVKGTCAENTMAENWQSPSAATGTRFSPKQCNRESSKALLFAIFSISSWFSCKDCCKARFNCLSSQRSIACEAGSCTDSYNCKDHFSVEEISKWWLQKQP